MMAKPLGTALLVFSLLTAAVITSACTGQEAVINELMLPSQGDQVYTFSTDIRDAVKIPSTDTREIRNYMNNNDNIIVVFDGTSRQDNGRFQTIVFNILVKLQAFYAYKGKLLNDVSSYYYITGMDGSRAWYNSTSHEISAPVIEGAVIWIMGPNTGATETSVRLDNNIITIQGTDDNGIMLAADKFVLAVIGVEDVSKDGQYLTLAGD